MDTLDGPSYHLSRVLFSACPAPSMPCGPLTLKTPAAAAGGVGVGVRHRKTLLARVAARTAQINNRSKFWGKQESSRAARIAKRRDGGAGSPPHLPPRRLRPPPPPLGSGTGGSGGGGRAAANPAARYRRAAPPLRHLQLRQAAAQQRPRAHSADGVTHSCLPAAAATASAKSVLLRCACAGGTAGISSLATSMRRSSARQVRFRFHRGLHPPHFPLPNPEFRYSSFSNRPVSKFWSNS